MKVTNQLGVRLRLENNGEWKNDILVIGFYRVGESDGVNEDRATLMTHLRFTEERSIGDYI